MRSQSNSLPEQQARSSHACRPWWKQARWWLVIALAAATTVAWGGTYRAQLLAALPYLLLLACPLMHLFMHRGHGHHGRQHDQGGPRDEQ